MPSLFSMHICCLSSHKVVVTGSWVFSDLVCPKQVHLGSPRQAFTHIQVLLDHIIVQRYRKIIHLASTLVGSHLQPNSWAVHGWENIGLGVIQMPPGPISIHARLAGTLVSAHLKGKEQGIKGIKHDFIKKYSLTDTQFYFSFFTCVSYLETNDTLPSLHFLLVKSPLLFICILHANFHPRLYSFCLSLSDIKL